MRSIMYGHCVQQSLTQPGKLQDCTIAIKIIGEKCYYGVSRVHPKDRFIKAIGRQKAADDLEKNIALDTNYITTDMIVSDLQTLADNFMRPDSEVYKHLTSVTLSDLKVGTIMNMVRSTLHMAPRYQFLGHK